MHARNKFVSDAHQRSTAADSPCIISGRRFAAALLPRLFGINPRSHHKGATGRVRIGNQRLPVLCHGQLGQDIPILYYIRLYYLYNSRGSPRPRRFPRPRAAPYTAGILYYIILYYIILYYIILYYNAISIHKIIRGRGRRRAPSSPISFSFSYGSRRPGSILRIIYIYIIACNICRYIHTYIHT